jgi:hypothetical protein
MGKVRWAGRAYPSDQSRRRDARHGEEFLHYLMHGTPGDRPPAVPAVFRCRARQHHGRTVSFAQTAPEVVRRNSDRADAAHYPGRAPPASTVLRIPLRGTRLRRAVHPGDLCRPSGPDGEGQAKGQARNARGEPQQPADSSLWCR